MQSSIINVGNSKGIIIPEDFLKQCAIEEEINIEVVRDSIIITTADAEKGKGWAESFKAMAENGDDRLLIPDIFEDEKFND
ncbi:MAG: AbrB/MazE/SpoVT family DNA-binding domain-containing protein [Mucilaginibacter sp.]